MESLLTIQNLTFVAGAIGVIFTIYNNVKNPQVDLEKKDALLSQQTKYNAESNDRRFTEVQNSFNALVLQSNNHIHTVDVKVETLNASVMAMSNEITRLGTIIDERIPKKIS